MKFNFDYDLLLSLDFDKFSSSRLEDSTPGYAFLRKRFDFDLARELAALMAILKTIKSKPPKIVLDLMAGCGFSAKLIEKYLNPNILILNDLDPICVDMLKDNFPRRKVTQQNALHFEWNDLNPDLTFIDFNVFTLKTYRKWKPLLEESFQRSKKVLLTDSAIFGFKFGNMKHYGIEFGVYLTKYICFSSASLALFGRYRSEMTRIYPRKLSVNALEDKGFY